MVSFAQVRPITRWSTRRNRLDVGACRVARLIVIAVAFGAVSGGRANVPPPSQKPVHPAPIYFTGVVHIDRPDVTGLNAPARDLLVQWKCQDGQAVKRGDPIVTFDNALLVQQVVLRELDLRIAEATLQHQDLKLADELEQLLEEQALLRTDLAVARAALAKARSIDPEQVALLRAEYDKQVQQAKVLLREERNKQELVDLGDLAMDELVMARLATKKSQGQAALKHLAWQRQSTRIDSLNVARLEMKERTLLLKLGDDDQVVATDVTDAADAPPATTGPTSDKRGIARRIDARQGRIERERTKNEASLNRARKQLHDALRDAYDHTPVNFVEVLNVDTDEPVRRIAFSLADKSVPDGYETDQGATFDAERGYGWDRDLGDLVHRRDKGEPLQAGVLLVRRQATWRCNLPNDRYKLRIGVGDAVDWHTPIISHNGTVIFVAEHLQNWQVIEHEAEVTDGMLTLVCGGELDKVIRAPANGVAKGQPWIDIGDRIRWKDWPIAFYSDPAKFKVQALVRQDMVALLKATEPDGDDAPKDEESNAEDEPSIVQESGAGEGEELRTVDSGQPTAASPHASLRRAEARSDVATSLVSLITPDGVAFDGQVESIDTSPVKMSRDLGGWYWGAEKTGKDLIARQVLIKPGADQVRRLQLGETVQCTAWIKPGDDVVVIPAHMVAEGERRSFVKLEATGKHEIEGFRVGQHYFVIAGLQRDAELVEPFDVNPDEELDHRKFSGEVVAGKRDGVGIPRGWGRIKEMVPDGSHVKKGQQIISLYNPWLDANRDKIEEEQVKAREEYLVAMETRRVKTVRAQLEHDQKVIAEGETRVNLRAIQEQDPIELERARAAWDQLRLQADLYGSRHARLLTIQGPSRSALAAARVKADKAVASLTRARIDLIAASRQGDWLKINEARRTWLDAVDALSLRESALQIVRQEEQVARMAAQMRLQNAIEGDRWQRRFEANKNIKAPTTGRIFYNTGWNDHVQARTKIMKDFVVWGGLPIADILDMSQLGMKSELPQHLYAEIEVGSEVMVGFGQYPGVQVEGIVDEIGMAFFVPEEASDEDHGDQSVNIRRVFNVTVHFSPPPALAHQFVPGTKGYVVLR